MSDNVFFSNKTSKLRGAGHVLPLRYQCQPASADGQFLMRSQDPGGARRSRTDDILLAKQALYQLSYGPIPSGMVRSPGELSYDTVQGWSPAGLVGPGRLELPTLRLSGVRSNHLSYGPMAATARSRDPGSRSRHQLNDPYGRGVDDESGKRNGDGGVPQFVPSAIALLLERISYWSLNRQSRERRPGEASLERR